MGREKKQVIGLNVSPDLSAQQGNGKGCHEYNHCHGKRDLQHDKQLSPQRKHLGIAQAKLGVTTEPQEYIIPKTGLPIFPTFER